MSSRPILSTHTPLHPEPPAPSLRPKPPHGTTRDERGRTRKLISATVRICSVSPASEGDAIVTAVVRTITTAYTEPGDRILLVDARTPDKAAARAVRDRRDQLVEAVLRLGRGATTDSRRALHDGRDCRSFSAAPSRCIRSESGPGPAPGTPADAVVNRTDESALSPAAGLYSTRFRLIIMGCADHFTDPKALPVYTAMLDDDGALIAIAHSSARCRNSLARSGVLCRAAATAGLALTERLNLVHQPPALDRPLAGQARRLISRRGGRRIQTTAYVFRKISSSRCASDKHGVNGGLER